MHAQQSSHAFEKRPAARISWENKYTPQAKNGDIYIDEKTKKDWCRAQQIQTDFHGHFTGILQYLACIQNSACAKIYTVGW